MKKVVTIGGGTGHFNLLQAIKNLDIDLTAIVSMADSGGSTGQLRDEYGVLPPGDVLKCLIALSPYEDARQILQSRFKSLERLKNHNAGNMLLVFLSQYLGNDFVGAIMALGEILNIKGKVLPVTTDKVTLVAQLTDGGKLFGESAIDIVRGKSRAKIKDLYLVPHNGKLEVYIPAAKVIEKADFIFISPGDLYTSIIPNLLVDGVEQAIKKSKAKFVYFPNIMTKYGETDGYAVSDFVKVVEKYIKRPLDQIIVNNARPKADVLRKYQQEKAKLVSVDLEDPRLIVADLLSKGLLARHDCDKLGKIVEQKVM